MVSLSTLVRYAINKYEYSISLSWKKYNVGQMSAKEFTDAIWKNFFQGKLTFLHWTKGEEMAPTVTAKGGTLLVRKMPLPAPTDFSISLFNDKLEVLSTHRTKLQVFVGDVVMLRNPEKPDDYLVRRLAAIEGYEMVSKDEKDEPFVLEKDQCWVISDNESLKAKEAIDSRLFGPVPMSNIVGRVIYALRSAVDHGPVENSHLAMSKDAPVLAVELDVDEMAKSTKI